MYAAAIQLRPTPPSAAPPDDASAPPDPHPATTNEQHPATIFHFRPNPKSDGLKPITPPPPLAPTDRVDGDVPPDDDSHPRRSAAPRPSTPVAPASDPSLPSRLHRRPAHQQLTTHQLHAQSSKCITPLPPDPDCNSSSTIHDSATMPSTPMKKTKASLPSSNPPWTGHHRSNLSHSSRRG
ncbi:hypothetical protein ACLOJK_033660 [Asimina triloba]